MSPYEIGTGLVGSEMCIRDRPPPAPVTSKPPTIPKATKKSKSQPMDTETKSPEQEDVILEEQLLGVTKRPTRGLTESVKEEEKIDEVNSTSSKAQEIIEASKARANAKFEVKEKKPQSAIPANKPTRPSVEINQIFNPLLEKNVLIDLDIWSTNTRCADYCKKSM